MSTGKLNTGVWNKSANGLYSTPKLGLKGLGQMSVINKNIAEKPVIKSVVKGISNQNIKMSSFKSSENIQKKEGGPDRSVSSPKFFLILRGYWSLD